MKNKLEEYRENQKDWRDISINQLSNANNILLTFSAGLLVFIIEKSKVTGICKSHLGHNFLFFTYWFAIFFLSFSILFGFSVLIARLYNARISRHLALTRQRYYEKNEINKINKLSQKDFEDFNRYHRINTFYKILFCKLPFIKYEQIQNNENIRESFDSLRRTSKILGNATWIWTKIQILFFILSGIFYLIHSFNS